MRPLPLHPLLLAAFPVLFLWSQNADEAAPREVLPVVVAVVAGALVVTAVFALLLRDARRGALVAGVVALVALAYGFLGLGALPPFAGLLIAVVAMVGAAAVAARLPDDRVRSVTGTANLAGVVLVVAALVPAVLAVREGAGEPSPAATGTPGGSDEAPGAAVPEEPRDIWYLVPDRYARADTLAEVFDHDNSPFLDHLEEAGFDVLDGSVANYPKTAHSLAASLNLDYLDELEAPAGDPVQEKWAPVYRLLRDHALGRVVTDLGYDYVHLGMWWSPTQTAASATVTLNADRTSEFQRAFVDTTAWAAARELVGAGERDQRRWKYDHTEFQFDQLDRLAREDPERPRFVFAHLTIPHEPYVFDADGSFVPRELERERTREDNFVRQVEYANDRFTALVDTLVTGDGTTDPIVIIQADEGPHPRARTGPSYRWDQAPDGVLQEKLRILNAVHLPGVDATLPDTSTPVNTFRFVLSEYFGADLPPLPDEAYIFPHEEELYRFTEVTDRVR